MDQIEHQRWNANHYPGTRQLCDLCGEPTGRCEEDTLWDQAEEHKLCEFCWRKDQEEKK